LPRRVDDLTRVQRCFRQLRRIGDLQMERRDLRVQKVAAIERAGDREKTVDFRVDIDR
jgi:hypothetical protein